jgi:hypothetical protein
MKSMCNYLKHISLLLVLTLVLSSFQKQPDVLLGKWKNERYGVVVKIYKHNDRYFGNVLDAGTKRGNEKLKNGPLQVLQDFEKLNDSTYCCGSIYLPKAGIRITSDIEIIDNNNLVITGNIIGFKTREKWYRVK